MEASSHREYERRLTDHEQSIRSLYRQANRHREALARVEEREKRLRERDESLEDAIDKMGVAVNQQFTSLRRIAWTAVITFTTFTLALIGNLALELVARGG